MKINLNKVVYGNNTHVTNIVLLFLFLFEINTIKLVHETSNKEDNGASKEKDRIADPRAVQSKGCPSAIKLWEKKAYKSL